MNLVKNAEELAKKKHKGQFRKNCETEYFEHLKDVVKELKRMGITNDDILCTGWLHDTIEDTDTDYDEIHKKFNDKIADYVASVTKDTRLIKEEQEKQYIIQLENAPWQAKVVKLGDIIANFKDLVNSGYDKATQDVKVKNKLPYIFAIQSELISRKEVPQIENAKKELEELLKKHNQESL
jgi:guanosine-3',5'-bis(diphosphate) 3'-pyrophosphohydrolase